MNRFSNLRIFRDPTALEQAAGELEQARRDLLTACAQAEYYAAMRSMLELRIRRLEAQIRDLSETTE